MFTWYFAIWCLILNFNFNFKGVLTILIEDKDETSKVLEYVVSNTY